MKRIAPTASPPAHAFVVLTEAARPACRQRIHALPDSTVRQTSRRRPRTFRSAERLMSTPVIWWTARLVATISSLDISLTSYPTMLTRVTLVLVKFAYSGDSQIEVLDQELVRADHACP